MPEFQFSGHLFLLIFLCEPFSNSFSFFIISLLSLSFYLFILIYTSSLLLLLLLLLYRFYKIINILFFQNNTQSPCKEINKNFTNFNTRNFFPLLKNILFYFLFLKNLFFCFFLKWKFFLQKYKIGKYFSHFFGRIKRIFFQYFKEIKKKNFLKNVYF